MRHWQHTANRSGAVLPFAQHQRSRYRALDGGGQRRIVHQWARICLMFSLLIIGLSAS
nr:hypothetical protein [Escherichia coli]